MNKYNLIYLIYNPERKTTMKSPFTKKKELNPERKTTMKSTFTEKKGIKNMIRNIAISSLLIVIASLSLINCTTEPEPTPTFTPVPPTSIPIPEPTATPTPIPPTATPIPEPTAEPTPDLSTYAQIPGIVDPTNFGWPRQIESSEGVVTTEAPVKNAHMLSLGHAEIMLALVGPKPLSATYSFYSDPQISNITDQITDIPVIGFDPEEVVALEPDFAIVSRFTDADLVAILKEAGIPVIRTSLENSTEGNIPNILLMAYAFGAEQRGLQLADEIQTRLQYIQETIQNEDPDKPLVLSTAFYDSIWVAGTDSTENGIIIAAGGTNAATEAGIESHQQVSIESIVAMNPDIIIITQPQESAIEYANMLKNEPAMQNVPAVKNNNIFTVPPNYFTTLSHWNIRGIETLAAILYPQIFSENQFEDFQPYNP